MRYISMVALNNKVKNLKVLYCLLTILQLQNSTNKSFYISKMHLQCEGFILVSTIK